jgi:prepilin-type N-terminal cleavage/methylation domain-containing protein
MRGGNSDIWTSDQKPTGGFTLVEMLVVMAILALLLGLLVPMIAGVRADAKSTACLNNLRQLHLAMETSRQNAKGLLPFCAPLPAPTPSGPEGGLPEKMKDIIPRDSETWLCPADDTPDALELKTSYFYLPGAWMLVEPPNLSISASESEKAIARVITQRWESGFLSPLPLLADAGEYHTHGGQEPWNVIFLDGHARASKPSDGELFDTGDDDDDGGLTPPGGGD